MKNRKVVLSMILVMAMLTTMLSGLVASAQADMDTVMFDLQSLGIMVGDENGEMQLDQPVTRAEFTTIVVRLMGMADVAPLSAAEMKFSDVPPSHWAAGYINLLSGMRVIDGTDENTFEPEANITIEAVCKILVNTLGYSMPANAKGGFPTGYMMQASEIGLLKNLGQTQIPLTRGEIARVVYNALDINMMVASSTGSTQTYEVSYGKTLRSDLTDMSAGNLMKMTGIVTATIDTWLLAPVASITEDQVEINGKIYEVQDPSFKQYAGQWVDFFVYEDDNTGKDVITDMKPNVKNQVWTVNVDNLKETNNTKVAYYTEGTSGSYEQLSVNGETAYVLNNRLQSTWTAENLMDLDHGSITLIDNDNDDVVEVVFIKSHSSVIVEDVMEQNWTVYFKDGFLINGYKDLELAPDDLDKIVTLIDAEGNSISPEIIKKGDVLSIFSSGDGENTEVVYSDKQVQGIINAVDDDTITIGEENYTCEDKSLLQTAVVGQEVRAYINYLNEVVYIEKETVDNYAYILETSAGNAMSADYQIRALIPDTLAEKMEEVENEDGGESTSVAKIACKNKEVRVLDIADRASVIGYHTDVDGNPELRTQKISSSVLAGLKGQVIAYKTNAQGQINEITFPEAVNTYDKKYYNSYERTFGKSSGGAFGVSEQTMTICIPDPTHNDSPTDDDYMVNVEMNNGQQYTVTGYDVNDDTHTVELIVVTMNMKAGNAGVITTSNKVGFVNKVSVVANEDGDAIQKITMITEGKETEFLVSDDIEDQSQFREVENGDLISYSLDVSDRIDAVKVLGKFRTEPALGQIDKRGDYETFCGYLVDADFDQVSEDKNRWVHTLYCGFDSDGNSEQTYEVTRSSGPPVFIYDSSEKKATLGDIKQIRQGYDKIFVSATANSSTVRAIVVIR